MSSKHSMLSNHDCDPIWVLLVSSGRLEEKISICGGYVNIVDNIDWLKFILIRFSLDSQELPEKLEQPWREFAYDTKQLKLEWKLLLGNYFIIYERVDFCYKCIFYA